MQTIDKDSLEAFRQTGLLHFICLSGMNFAMVIGIVWWICKTAGLLKRGRAIVCMLSAVLFLMVVPENPPAFRAAVMCFAFCAAFIFRRKSNPFNSLALAAIVLLLIRPTMLFEPGWQLSFASVLGILLLAEPINAFLHETAFNWFGRIDKQRLTIKAIIKIATSISSVFAVSLAAWLSTVGIMLYHFYAIQYLTSIWTVLVSPLIGLVSILGYLKLIIALISPSIGAALGYIVNILAKILILIVKLIASLDISEILVGKTIAGTIILYYALMIFAFLLRSRNMIFKKFVCAIATVSLIVMLATPRWQNAHSDNLTMTVLDVGHGQAVLARFPGGTNTLFDAGSLSRSDIGTRVITPFLRYSHIRNIDAVVISHGDIDHINGLPEIMDYCPAKVIYAGNVFFDEENYRPPVKFLRGEMRKKSIEIIPADDKMQTGSRAAIKLLWPDPEIYNDNNVGDNDKSLAMMIEYAGRQILLCSDIEKFAQEEILQLYPGLKADVLIAPHHGSIKTLNQDFITSLAPDVVICSCTRTAYEKGQVIKENDNFRLYYTGRDGAVIVSINPDGTVKVNKSSKEK